MVKQIWINLPVLDLKRAVNFYTQLGFSFNSKNGNTENSACMVIGEHNIPVMLFTEPVFKTFTKSNIADAQNVAEVLISIDAQSVEEVDDMVLKARDAGAVIFAEPGYNQGWMYGCGFSDIDGHRWNVLYMDMEKMPR